MRILYLLQSTRFSGAENVVCQIIGMSRSAADLEMIYCSPDGQIREALKEREIQFEAIKELSLKEVKRVIEKYRPDIIHAHDRSACIVAAIASKDIPIVAHIHVNNNRGVLSFIKNTLLVLFKKKYHHIFWVSDSAYEQFHFKNMLKEKSSVLYNVVDIKALYEKVDKDEATYDYDIVYIGRLSYQKNPERLMRLLRRVSEVKNNVKIAIVGSGEYEQYVIKYIKDYDLEKNITYLGYFSNPLKILKSSKILVMTSRFEGTPMIALEAQCLGVPIVSTPTDGLTHLIRNHENGYLSNDDKELLEEMITILNDESLQKKLSCNSIEKAMKLNNKDHYIKEIMKVYNGCLHLKDRMYKCRIHK